MELRIQLMHEFGRPYYFGMDVLCDGASENAELFLQLAGRLVTLFARPESSDLVAPVRVYPRRSNTKSLERRPRR